MSDPILRGNRWRAFYNEDDGLKDMLATIKATYLERIAACNPMDVEQLRVLATAHKVTTQLEGMVRAIIDGADVAQASKEWTTKMQQIPAAARRFM